MNASSPRFLTKHKTVILVLMLSLPIVLCGGLVAWWFGRQAAAHEQVEKMRADIRARGLPVDDASMTEFRARTMSHEKTERWTAVLNAVASDAFVLSRNQLPFVDPGYAPPEVHLGQPYESSAELREFLDRWSELRREVHVVTEASAAIWTNVDFQGYFTDLELAHASRWVTRLLDLEHRDAIARQDDDGAFHCLLALIGTARTHELEPMMVSQLVQDESLRIMLNRLKQSVELDLLDENQLQEVLVQLTPLDDFGNGYRLSFVGERAMSQPMFDDVIVDPDFSELPRWSGIGNRRIDALASLEWIAKTEAITTTDLTMFYIQTNAFNDQLTASLQGASPVRQFETSLTRLLMTDSRAYSHHIVYTAMMLRIAKLAIGLRLFEHQNGAWPDSLDQLTIDPIGVDLGPITPIGARPFGYRVKGDEGELWGFVPAQTTDETPDAPVDPKTMPEENQKSWSYFRWSLSRDPS